MATFGRHNAVHTQMALFLASLVVACGHEKLDSSSPIQRMEAHVPRKASLAPDEYLVPDKKHHEEHLIEQGLDAPQKKEGSKKTLMRRMDKQSLDPHDSELIEEEHVKPAASVVEAGPTQAGITGKADKGSANKSATNASRPGSRLPEEDSTILDPIKLSLFSCFLLIAIAGAMARCRSGSETEKAARQGQDFIPSLQLDVLLMSGEMVASIVVSVDDLGSTIKAKIEEAKGVNYKVRQLLIAGRVVEDDQPLNEYGPFQSNHTSGIVLREAEWQVLTLEGKWKPTRVEDWQPQEWFKYVQYRAFDGNAQGHVQDSLGGKRPRGPYRLTNRNPPIWETKIAGTDHTGTECLKLLPGGHMEIWQKRSNREEPVVFHFERESRMERLRSDLYHGARSLLIPWEGQGSSPPLDLPAQDWLDSM